MKRDNSHYDQTAFSLKKKSKLYTYKKSNEEHYSIQHDDSFSV